MDGLLGTVFIYLLMAVMIVPLSKRLGLGSVLGYLLAGIIIGPISGFAEDHQSLLHIGEIGVVMMLFLIGLELEPRLLWRLRYYLVGLGGAQLLITAILIAIVSMIAIPVWQQALSIGLMLAISSTAIVLQTLEEKSLTKTPAGRAMFSVLLFQDVAVIPILAILSLLSLTMTRDITPTLDESSLHGLLQDSWYVLLVFGVCIAVVLLGYLLSAPALNYIARTRLREIFTATALLLVVGSALLMESLGLSPALGAFLAGMVLARGHFVHEIRASIEPFKGVLLGLFFLGVGMSMNIGLLSEKPMQIILATAVLLAVKFGVLLLVATVSRMPWTNRWLFALGLAQSGEFAFVLLSFALESHLLSQVLVDELLVIVTLSMMVTPLLFILQNSLSEKTATKKHRKEADNIPEHRSQVVVTGVGRFGQIINRLLVARGVHTIVIDHDASLLEHINRTGVQAYYGDATKPDLLNAIGLGKVQLLVVAIDDRSGAVALVRYVKRHFPDVKILARAYDRLHLYSLRKAGADLVIRETFLSAIESAKEALKMLGENADDAEEYAQEFADYEKETIDQLFEVWSQNPEINSNDAYLAGVRQRNEELRRAIANDDRPGKEGFSLKHTSSSSDLPWENSD